MIEEKYKRVLELPRVLELLSSYAVCDETKAMAIAIEPSTSLAEVDSMLALTSEAHSLTNRYGYPTILRMKNCDSSIKRAQVGGSLNLREMLDIVSILCTVRGLYSWKEQIEKGADKLSWLFECLSPNRQLENRLSSAIISEEELDDNASAELSQIRRGIRAAGLKIRSQLDSMIHSTTYQKYLQEPIVTMRDDRFVIPVKAEYRGEVKGLIHDTSSSGATYFIEPMSVVEANNEIRVLKSKEEREIERILAELSALIADSGDSIMSGYRSAVQLDLLFAKSHLADKMKAMLPTISDSGKTMLRRARHPLISDAVVVPIDISVGDAWDTLVITGPNTGGKTVAIKTLGLLSLMAMCGLMLPTGDGCHISVYTSVFADIGDEQSIEQSLSTFSSHMTNIIRIISLADHNSLVLLDELCAGTDPTEGAALAVAIIQSLREKGSRIAATTHYAEIKMYALQTAGVENASCEFDITTLRPTYKLITGIPGRSNAFLISEKLGLESHVIDKAKELLSTESSRFEDLVGELEATRQALEAERETARLARMETQKLLAEAGMEKKRLVHDRELELTKAKDQARRMIEEIKLSSELLMEELEEIKKQKSAENFSQLVSGAKTTQRQIIREAEERADPVSAARMDENYKLPRPLKRGDEVIIRSIGAKGSVLSVTDDGGNVVVQAGIIKTTVPLKDLILSEEGSKRVTVGGRGVSTKGVSSVASRQFKQEINLLGLDSNEAIMELEAFLDQALLSGIKSVRIIHGKGAGILRKAVQQYLKGNRSVENFRLGVYGEGENGVTIAELK